MDSFSSNSVDDEYYENVDWGSIFLAKAMFDTCFKVSLFKISRLWTMTGCDEIRSIYIIKHRTVRINVENMLTLYLFFAKIEALENHVTEALAWTTFLWEFGKRINWLNLQGGWILV